MVTLLWRREGIGRIRDTVARKAHSRLTAFAEDDRGQASQKGTWSASKQLGG